GGATAETERAYPTTVRELEQILANYVFRDDASVADSLIATRHVYDLFVENPTQSDASTDDSANSSEGSEGQGGETSLEDAEGDQSDQQQRPEVSEDPFSFLNSGQT